VALANRLETARPDRSSRTSQSFKVVVGYECPCGRDVPANLDELQFRWRNRPSSPQSS
jgi:hypothetical protein